MPVFLSVVMAWIFLSLWGSRKRIRLYRDRTGQRIADIGIGGAARQLKEAILSPAEGPHIILVRGPGSPRKAAIIDAYGKACSPLCESLTTDKGASTEDCILDAEQSLSGGKTVIVSSPFASAASMAPYLRLGVELLIVDVKEEAHGKAIPATSGALEPVPLSWLKPATGRKRIIRITVADPSEV